MWLAPRFQALRRKKQSKETDRDLQLGSKAEMGMSMLSNTHTRKGDRDNEEES